MTYGDSVGNENPDTIWTAEVQARNAASALNGLQTLSKQEHPSQHNGAAMQSEGERMSTLTMMRNMLPLAAIGGAELYRRNRNWHQQRAQADDARAAALQTAQHASFQRQAEASRRARTIPYDPSHGFSVKHGLTMLSASPSGRGRIARDRPDHVGYARHDL